MAQSGTGPSRSGFTSVVIEEVTITNVNKRNYTCSVVTRHSSKNFDDIQLGMPYFNNANGEGIYVMPEVGAIAQLCRGSDTTPPFIMCFIAAPTVLQSDTSAPLRSTPDGGSTTDISYRGGRLDIQPGDIAMTTRDENFLILRRGGILQIGATDIAQRMYIPIGNFIRDVCENYSMDTLGGNIKWAVERSESSPSGDAPVSYVFNVGEHAQDKKASVSVRHFPTSGPQGEGLKYAWEVVVARNGVDRDTGELTDQKYTMSVAQDGTKLEMIGAKFTQTIKGNHNISATGNINYTASGTATLQGGSEARIKAAQVVTDGVTLLGGADAVEPAVLGQQLGIYLTAIATVLSALAPPGTVLPPPPTMFSTKVRVS